MVISDGVERVGLFVRSQAKPGWGCDGVEWRREGENTAQARAVLACARILHFLLLLQLYSRSKVGKGTYYVCSSTQIQQLISLIITETTILIQLDSKNYSY